MTTQNDQPGDRWQAPDYSKRPTIHRINDKAQEAEIARVMSPAPVAAPAQGETPASFDSGPCPPKQSSTSPRTDEIYLSCADRKRANESEEILLALARQLERELNEAKAEAEHFAIQLSNRHSEVNTLRAQVAQLTSERDEAETSLAEWMSTAQRRADKLTAATEGVELAELRKDKARLDALSGMKCAEFMEGPCVWRINMDERTDSEQLRAAVDAARNQQDNKE